MLASICESRSRKPRKQYSRTVKRLFTGFQTNFQRLWRNMERKPLKSHATVVAGQATVGRLSINVFSTFQAIRNFVEKVAERSRDSGRRSRGLSADCQTTIFRRFKQLEIFWKSRWTVTRQWSEVTRPSADCQTTFFERFKRFGKILKKVAERSRDSGWSHATVGRLSNNVFWTFQAFRKKFEKSRWTVTRQWSEVTRPSADCQTTFLDVSSDLGKFWKKSLNGHATVVEVTRPSGRLSNNVFWTFQAIRKKIWKKSRNGHATVVGGHATVGWLSNNVFWTFQAIWENFESKVKVKVKSIIGRRSRDRQVFDFLTVDSDAAFTPQLGKFWKK